MPTQPGQVNPLSRQKNTLHMMRDNKMHIISTKLIMTMQPPLESNDIMTITEKPCQQLYHYS